MASKFGRICAPGLPQVNIDREQFKRVVVNLVDNAAEAMQDSLVKQLYVGTAAIGADFVELTIADTGCGISPEDKEKLFLPYFTRKHAAPDWASRSSTTSCPSTARRSASKITIRTERASLSRSARMVSDTQPARNERMKRQRVLVVDDEPGIRSSLCGVLEDEGYEVEAVATARPVWRGLAERPFDAVLLDVWLPGIDGMETLSRIQEIPQSDRPMVVMISGHGTIETAVRATKLGAFDFLEKPLTIEKVVGAGEERVPAAQAGAAKSSG